jgi:hypothetical protein
VAKVRSNPAPQRVCTPNFIHPDPPSSCTTRMLVPGRDWLPGQTFRPEAQCHLSLKRKRTTPGTPCRRRAKRHKPLEDLFASLSLTPPTPTPLPQPLTPSFQILQDRQLNPWPLLWHLSQPRPRLLPLPLTSPPLMASCPPSLIHSTCLPQLCRFSPRPTPSASGVIPRNDKMI